MKRTILLLAMATMILGSSAVLAQTNGGASAGLGTGYDLSWWTVDGGGGTVNGGGYTMMGTAGQADTGPALSGGGYTLTGGFWAGRSAGGPTSHTTYLPVVSKRH